MKDLALKMSKSHLAEGISLNTDQRGLLKVEDELLSKLIKKEPISNIYVVEQTPFARGKFATVRKATHRVSGVQYAAKFIRKRRRASDQRQDILHEVAVLRATAGNARIVCLHEVYETAAEMALVLELASGGELQRVLDTQEGLPESQAVRVMSQILEGLSFLHGLNIAHLDLKPQNLLLTDNFPGSDIKLCDFGISRVIQSGVEVREILGTPDYVAPEILSYEPISLATDVWSVGVLAYVLLSGYSPFGGETKQETFCNISQCNLTFPEELFDGVSKTAQDFIQATLMTDPSQRMTSQQCLEHPWLAGVCSVVPESIGVSLLAAVEKSGTERSHGTKAESKTGVIASQEEKINVPPECNGTNAHVAISCVTPEKKSSAEDSDEQDDQLPLNKRPKNSSPDDHRSSFPLASCVTCGQYGSQCRHMHAVPRTPELRSRISRSHRLQNLSNSPVEITVDRGIIC